MPERRAGGAAKGLRAPVRRALTASGRFQYRPGEPSAGLKEHRPASARSPRHGFRRPISNPSRQVSCGLARRAAVTSGLRPVQGNRTKISRDMS